LKKFLRRGLKRWKPIWPQITITIRTGIPAFRPVVLEMASKEDLVKKANLLILSRVYLEPGMKLPFRASRSTAGPGAGERSIHLEFKGHRVKLEVSKDESQRLHLRQGIAGGGDQGFTLHMDGEVYISGVTLKKPLLHAPRQAFINLGSGCTMSCRFCPTPNLGIEQLKEITPARWVELIVSASCDPDFDSVGITSGVPSDPDQAIEEMCEVIVKVVEKIGAVPIGVEPYVSDLSQIQRLKDCGATEIKINLQSYDREIFERVCPEMDLDLILDSIKEACDIFGRNKVCSNLLLGLGESDESVRSGIEHLANYGAVATLRPYRSSETTDRLFIEALRIVNLALAHKEILERYGLTPLEFKTMCHACGGCELLPGVDL